MKLSRVFLLFLILATLISCGESEPAQVMEQRTAALGEPVGEYPSWAERVVLYLTNRARVQPELANPASPYPATPPVRWDLRLSEAARFHAGHIRDANCWCEDHSSCCQLNDVGGEVSCGGGVTGCGAMGASERVALWSSKYSGENMAMGYPTPEAVIEGWIQSPGHWTNMNGAHTLLGPGQDETYWVQDFGNDGSPPPVIGDGIHMNNGQAYTFGITYYQKATGGPQAAVVIVDGECHDLELVAGEPEAGAFETVVSPGAGCHRYYFHFTDGNGNFLTYPTSGSLGAGNDDCPLFLDSRPADTCSPSGQGCQTGDTRACYTGPFGTRDVGICSSGAERCIAGQWTGECNAEVQPEDAEVCANNVDENCNGEVDEGCPSIEDMGTPEPDSGADSGMGGSDDESKSSSEGCSVLTPSFAASPLGLLCILLIVTIRRRQLGVRS